MLLDEQIYEPPTTKRGSPESRHHRHERVPAVPTVPTPPAPNRDDLRSRQRAKGSELFPILGDGEIEVQLNSGPSEFFEDEPSAALRAPSALLGRGPNIGDTDRLGSSNGGLGARLILSGSQSCIISEDQLAIAPVCAGARSTRD